jgi:predicted transcriptional regulator
MKNLKIGIMSQDKIRERTLAIAKGDYKPTAHEPKIWFTSLKALAEIISDENHALNNQITNAQKIEIKLY